MNLRNHNNEVDSRSFTYPWSSQREAPSDTTRTHAATGAQTVYIKRFSERAHFSLDDLEYPRNGIEPGKVLIFNQEVFEDSELDYRRGSVRDVNELIICMQRLGFNIEKGDICTDYTAEGIFKKLDEVIADSEHLSNCNCLILFFLSHGKSSEELHASDSTIKISQLWEKLAKCEELDGKPKMFVIQACKGDSYSTISGTTTLSTQPPPSPLVDISQFTSEFLSPDMLVVYATIEGNVSFRNPLTGTWFIQELCKNFAAYGRRDDVLTMLIRVNKCVTGNYYNYNKKVSRDIQKQMPIFISTLSKKFYLNRNKDRDMLLQIKKRLDRIGNDTAEILDILKHNKKGKK
ncbi:caspase-6-like [Cylas formicarius]|uniref:caspase-6-like n=1 Tax=Cylas formicarius TaxID=197179 RepID=UPI00295867BE|nr:caspase-6-like [Cylas formicarius]